MIFGKDKCNMIGFVILFYIWAIIGLIPQLFFILKLSAEITGLPSVAQSSYQANITLTWIGGMVFFGPAALLCAAWRMLPAEKRRDFVDWWGERPRK